MRMPISPAGPFRSGFPMSFDNLFTMVFPIIINCWPSAATNEKEHGVERPCPHLLWIVKFPSLILRGKDDGDSPVLPVSLPGCRCPR